MFWTLELVESETSSVIESTEGVESLIPLAHCATQARAAIEEKQKSQHLILLCEESVIQFLWEKEDYMVCIK